MRRMLGDKLRLDGTYNFHVKSHSIFDYFKWNTTQFYNEEALYLKVAERRVVFATG